MSEPVSKLKMARLLCGGALGAVVQLGADHDLPPLDWGTNYNPGMRFTGRRDDDAPALRAWAELLGLVEGLPEQGSLEWSGRFAGVRLRVWGVLDPALYARHLPAERRRGAPRMVKVERRH